MSQIQKHVKVPSTYKRLNDMATVSEKTVDNWMKNPVGKDAIAQFKKDHPEIKDPIITVRGRGKAQGTYAHPSLAAIFAAWCNPQFTAKLSDEVIRMRDCMKALQAKNTGNIYQLEATKDFDDRLQYLVDAGYSYEHIAAMKPIPVKQGYPGFVVEGKYAEEVAKQCGLKLDCDCNRVRAVIGKYKYNSRGKRIVNSPLGKKSIWKVGLDLASFGFAAYIWGTDSSDDI